MYARFKRGSSPDNGDAVVQVVRDWERVEVPLPEWSACFA